MIFHELSRVEGGWRLVVMVVVVGGGGGGGGGILTSPGFGSGC